MNPSLHTSEPLEFRRLGPELTDGLSSLFQALSANHDDEFFHPHPLTPAHAALICADVGRDLGYAAIRGPAVLAYGMLRGWEQGFSVPSLGIAVHPAFRGQGLSTAFMCFLHSSARLQGAAQIRLKVYKTNAPALALYRRLGYRLEEANEREMIGFIDLAHSVAGGRTT